MTCSQSELIREMVKLDTQVKELRTQATHIYVNCARSQRQEAYLRSLLFILYADSMTHLKDSVTVHQSGNGTIWGLDNLLKEITYDETPKP